MGLASSLRHFEQTHFSGGLVAARNMPLNTCPQPGHSRINTGIRRFLMSARIVVRALGRPWRIGATAQSEQIN
jgi:hypothetical protein